MTPTEEAVEQVRALPETEPETEDGWLLSCRHESTPGCPNPDCGEYPYYGVAPHECFYKKGEDYLPGQSTLLPREKWPDSFVLDLEPGERPEDIVYPSACGTYYCPFCKRWMPTDPPPLGKGRHERAHDPQAAVNACQQSPEISMTTEDAVERVRKPDHEAIWLEPECCAGCDGRTWSFDCPWEECEAGVLPTKYVRADLYEALLAEREALREANRPITMQDVRLAVGEGKLTPADVLAGCNAELRRRAALQGAPHER